MEEAPDTGLDGDTWLSTGAAADLVGVDRRTIVRWVDRGQVQARITPGGRRKVSKQGLLAAFDRETAGRRKNKLPPAAGRSAPETAVLYLASCAQTWGDWNASHLANTPAKLFALQEAVRLVKDGLDDIEIAVDDAVGRLLIESEEP